MKLLWLAMAGAAGTLARYGLTVAIQGWLAGRGARSPLGMWLGAHFPLGTLLINIAGSFLLAFVATLVLAGTVKPDWRLIIGTGFCGAFTTFSAFELEADELLARGAWTGAGIYIVGNLVCGFAAVLLGHALATRLAGPTAFAR